MPVFASIITPPMYEGALYCLNKLLPAIEGTLFNLSSPYVDPITVVDRASITAVVSFSVQAGPLTTQLGYVVMQTDMGDGVWIDVAWCTFSALTGTAVWVLAGGVAGANAFQQTRGEGSAPSPQSGSNQFQLGGRIRFVGKSTNTVAAGSSSSSARSSSSSGAPGVTPGVLVTIRYKELGLR